MIVSIEAFKRQYEEAGGATSEVRQYCMLIVYPTRHRDCVKTLDQSANGAKYESLGHRPRKGIGRFRKR